MTTTALPRQHTALQTTAPDTLSQIGAATLTIISLMDTMGHGTVAGHLHYQTTRHGNDADIILDLLAVAANSRTRGNPDELLEGLKQYTRAIGWDSGLAESREAVIPRHQEDPR